MVNRVDTFIIVPMPHRVGNDNHIGNHVRNKNKGAYASNSIKLSLFVRPSFAPNAFAQTLHALRIV